jgi:hypothetical protein
MINFRITNGNFTSNFDFIQYPSTKYSYEIITDTRKIRISSTDQISQFTNDLPSTNKLDMIILEKVIMNSLRKLRIAKVYLLINFKSL